MNKLTLLVSSIFILNTTFAQTTNLKTLHDFTTTTIDGKVVDLSTLKGKKVLVVNTASKCGNTPQYAELEQLFKKYKESGFTIVGFPSNDFGRQEPGSNVEIAEFCKMNYGVTFLMMSKIAVKGDSINPIYEWLTQKEQNGVADVKVKWNFQKFMIDENGKWVDFVEARESPLTEKIIKWIEGGN